MKASSVRVSTSRYEFAHGRKPRGFGVWAFEIITGTIEIIPGSMSYSEAKKAAQEIAASRNVSEIHVGP